MCTGSPPQERRTKARVSERQRASAVPSSPIAVRESSAHWAPVRRVLTPRLDHAQVALDVAAVEPAGHQAAASQGQELLEDQLRRVAAQPLEPAHARLEPVAGGRHEVALGVVEEMAWEMSS